MKRRNLWDAVDDIIASGRAPLITLPSTARIINSRPRGRPRINPPGDRFAGWKMRTPRGYPLRCRNFDCGRPLRKNQEDICCSEWCRGELRYLSECVLAVLDGKMPATDFPFHRWVRRSRIRVRRAPSK